MDPQVVRELILTYERYIRYLKYGDYDHRARDKFIEEIDKLKNQLTKKEPLY